MKIGSVPSGARVNRWIGADLWPGADLAINVICGVVVWFASANSKVGPLTSAAFTVLAAMPSVAAYFVKRYRDQYNALSWKGTVLYALGLSRIVIASILTFVVGLAFAANNL